MTQISRMREVFQPPLARFLANHISQIGDSSQNLDVIVFDNASHFHIIVSLLKKEVVKSL